MGILSIRNTYSGVRAAPRFTFTTNFVFFMVSRYFYSTPMKGTPRARVPSLSGSGLLVAAIAAVQGVPLGMSRMRPECPDSAPSDRSVAADALFRQEPEEEEDEEGDGKDDDDDDDDEGDDGYSE
jgi:hypothetical protein